MLPVLLRVLVVVLSHGGRLVPGGRCAGGRYLSACHQRKARSALEGASWWAPRGAGAVGEDVSTNVSVVLVAKAKGTQMRVTPTHRRRPWQTRQQSALATEQSPRHSLALIRPPPSSSTLRACDCSCDTCHLTNGPRLNSCLFWPARRFDCTPHIPFTCRRTSATSLQDCLRNIIDRIAERRLQLQHDFQIHT